MADVTHSSCPWMHGGVVCWVTSMAHTYEGAIGGGRASTIFWSLRGLHM